MKKISPSGCLLFGALVLCHWQQATAQDWFASDTTGKLEDVIFDFRRNLYQVHNQPRAFVVKGDYLQDRRNVIEHWPVHFVSVVTKNKQLYANSRTVAAIHQTRLIERWDQLLIDGGRVYQRGGPYEVEQSPMEHVEESRDAILKQFVRMDPVAMAVSGLHFASNRDRHRMPTKSSPPAHCKAVVSDCRETFFRNPIFRPKGFGWRSTMPSNMISCPVR